MNYEYRKLLADTAILAGELMLTSGAETHRAESTMNHILKKGTNATITTLALTTSIMVTIEAEQGAPLTIVRRIFGSSIKLSRIVRVNEISRNFCNDTITLEEAYQQLQQIPPREYSSRFYNIATIGIAVGFVMFFGGSFLDIVGSLCTSAVLAALITLCKRFHVGGFVLNCFSSAGLSLACMILKNTLLPTIDTDIVIIGSIMSLVPGVAITNAIRDTLQGDYLSGCARILEAFLTASAIAIGVGFGMLLFQLF